MMHFRSGLRLALISSLIATPVFIGTSFIAPESAQAGVFKKLKKTSHDATKPVTHGTEAAAKTVSQGTATATKTVVQGTQAAAQAVSSEADHASADAAAALKGTGAAKDEFEQTAHRVGETVFHSTVSIGKSVNMDGKTVNEISQQGKTVGYVVVEDSKIVAEATVVGGKVISTTAETGAKLIVSGGEIVGREVVVGGKVVGAEVIKDGKIVGHTVVAGGEYAVDAAGEIILTVFSKEACVALVKSVRSGTKVVMEVVPYLPALPSIDGAVDRAMAETKAMANTLDAGKKDAILNGATKLITDASGMVAELQRTTALLNQSRSKVMELFDPNTFCSLTPAQIDAKLAALNLKPNLPIKKAGFFDRGIFINQAEAATDKHFFFQINLSASAAASSGGVVNLSIVTDFQGAGGGYIGVGWELVSNVEADAGLGLAFYPVVDVDSFVGQGWGVAISAGPPTKIVSGNVGLELGDTISEFQGFGLGGAVGAGISPVDFGLSSTNTWHMKP